MRKALILCVLLAAALPWVAAAGDPSPATEPARSDGAQEPSPEAAPKQFPPRVTSHSGSVIRTVLGLSAILLLAWLGSHPRVRQLERTLGLRQALSTGLLFVLLGLVAAQPLVGVLDTQVLSDLTPLMHFALGWMGLLIGFQFDVRLLERLPQTTAVTVAVESLLPFLFVTAVGAALMSAFGQSTSDGAVLRDALALATAGAVTVAHIRDHRGPFDARAPHDAHESVDSLDEIAAVGGLALIAAFFRPLWPSFRWELPGTVWLLLTLGLGASVGLLTYAMLRGHSERPEFLAITLGSVALGAGAAGYLYLSPLVVCFVAGAVLANLPGDSNQRVWSILVQLERPMHYLLLTVAGALWDPTDWRGWALLPPFLAARSLALWLAAGWVRRAAAHGAALLYHERDAFQPISVLSIAIAVSMQSLYEGGAVSWIVTAVIGSAIVTEILSHARRGRRARVAA